MRRWAPARKRVCLYSKSSLGTMTNCERSTGSAVGCSRSMRGSDGSGHAQAGTPLAAPDALARPSEGVNDRVDVLIDLVERDERARRAPLIVNLLVNEGKRRLFGGFSNLEKDGHVRPSFGYYLGKNQGFVVVLAVSTISNPSSPSLLTTDPSPPENSELSIGPRSGY